MKNSPVSQVQSAITNLKSPTKGLGQKIPTSQTPIISLPENCAYRISDNVGILSSTSGNENELLKPPSRLQNLNSRRKSIHHPSKMPKSTFPKSNTLNFKLEDLGEAAVQAVRAIPTSNSTPIMKDPSVSLDYASGFYKNNWNKNFGHKFSLTVDSDSKTGDPVFKNILTQSTPTAPQNRVSIGPESIIYNDIDETEMLEKSSHRILPIVPVSPKILKRYQNKHCVECLIPFCTEIYCLACILIISLRILGGRLLKTCLKFLWDS